MRIVLGGGEKPAYEKLYMGLRYAQEAATEIGTYSGDVRWMTVATKLGEMLNLAIKLGGHTASKTMPQ